MGFPLFTPAYIPGNRIRVYGGHAILEQALRRQHAAPSFPVDFSALPAQIEFIRLEPGKRYDVAGLTPHLTFDRRRRGFYGSRLFPGRENAVYLPPPPPPPP